MNTRSEFKIDESQFAHCELCPRRCGVNRYDSVGFCGCGAKMRAARAALHMWEEPCISGSSGSGAVFFSGCTLRCRYCQNSRISLDNFGKEISVSRLAEIFLRLQDEGAANINLVTATQYLPLILPAIDSVRDRLHIPIVYNCGGYERVETVRALKDYVDIWLPDLKYYDPELSAAYSQAPDYFDMASQAILEMIEQTGAPRFKETASASLVSDDGPAGADETVNDKMAGEDNTLLMESGVIIRHLVLPGHRDDSIKLLTWMSENLPRGKYILSLMSQYTPYHTDERYPELNRHVTSYEYESVVDAALKLGLDTGYRQEKTSAREEYTPPFNLEGL